MPFSAPPAAKGLCGHGRAKCFRRRASPSKNVRAIARRARAANRRSDGLPEGSSFFVRIGRLAQGYTIYSIRSGGVSEEGTNAEIIPKKSAKKLKKCLTNFFIRANICKLSRKTACFFHEKAPADAGNPQIDNCIARKEKYVRQREILKARMKVRAPVNTILTLGRKSDSGL